MTAEINPSTGVAATAIEALARGLQPIPLRTRDKSPAFAGWTDYSWDTDDLDEIEARFAKWASEGQSNLGLLLGQRGGRLIDVDLDHPSAQRFARGLLPPTPMMSGRPARPRSHYWYIAREDTPIPSTRRYKLPSGEVTIELRADRMQTVIPPSIHPSGDVYMWEHEPFGGESGPAVVDGRILQVQVNFVALLAVLHDCWPREGSRHDAYLALAGGLLRHGSSVHPWWRRNLGPLIEYLAEQTHDDSDSRIAEVYDTTIKRLESGLKVQGFPTLAGIVGEDSVDMIRRLANDLAFLGGFRAEPMSRSENEQSEPDASDAVERAASILEDAESTLSDLTPLDKRASTWEIVDLDPYLTREITPRDPAVLRRADGRALFYEGRVNSLYGMSESAKTWIVLWACLQEIARGESILYIDMEDDPVLAVDRLTRLGAGIDDLRASFSYIKPEHAHADMLRDRWGKIPDPLPESSRINAEVLNEALRTVDPSLIVVDGMTVLYSLHGLDTNHAASTDVITSWLRRLTRGGRSTVIIIDHTGKNVERGSQPIGSNHKIAMVTGCAVQAWALDKPRPNHKGQVQLIVTKDRPGQVREHSVGDPALFATLEIDSTTTAPDGQPRTIITAAVPDPEVVHVETPAYDAASQQRERREQSIQFPVAKSHLTGDDLERYLEQRQRLLDHFPDLVGFTSDVLLAMQHERTLTGKPAVPTNKIKARVSLVVGCSPDDVYTALRSLREMGYITMSGFGKGTTYEINADRLA